MQKFVVFSLLCFCLVLSAQDIQQLQQENIELKTRLERLEKAMLELQQKNVDSTKQLSPQEQKLRQELQSENKDLLNRADKNQPNFLQTKFEVKLYGYVKLDMAYDLARSYPGNYILWVESEEALQDDDDQFNITANQSRLGLDIKAPNFLSASTTGKIEVDFFGSGPENKSQLRMRQVYLKLEWRDNDGSFSILAGQTWDVISPIFPTTVNFLALGYCGELGERRPQFRLTKEFVIATSNVLKLEVAAARALGRTGPFYPDYLDSGEDAGYPNIQGRIGWEFDKTTTRHPTFGISGHWGQEEYDTQRNGEHKRFDTWSLNLDLDLPITSKIGLKGTIWTGKNLDSYLGGIGQGVNITRGKEISASGGWLALELGPFDEWRCNFGFGVDDPEDKDLNVGQRRRNWSIFGNVFYNFGDFLDIGVEISYWDTAYYKAESGTSIRVQTAMIYKF